MIKQQKRNSNLTQCLVQLSLLLSLFLIGQFADAAQESTILFDKKQKIVNTTTKPIRWSVGSDRISILFKSRILLGIKSIDLAAGHPNAMQFRAIYDNGMKPGIFLDWTKASGCIDTQTGELNDGCFIDIALHDFDSDGIPEIVLSVGDGLIRQMVYIIQYHPPMKKEDIFRSENWTWNTLDGQSQCYISGDSISFRTGSRGFDDTYFFKSGKLYHE